MTYLLKLDGIQVLPNNSFKLRYSRTEKVKLYGSEYCLIFL